MTDYATFRSRERRLCLKRFFLTRSLLDQPAKHFKPLVGELGTWLDLIT